MVIVNAWMVRAEPNAHWKISVSCENGGLCQDGVCECENGYGGDNSEQMRSGSVTSTRFLIIT